MINFPAYECDAIEEAGCIHAANIFNLEEKAKLPVDQQAVYINKTPKQYASMRFKGMMRSWARQAKQADAAAAAKAVIDANPIPEQ